MRQKWLLFPLLFMIGLPQAKAILNGKKINTNEASAFQFMTGLSIDGYQSSASYLGEGFFLTAHHAIEDINLKNQPVIKLTNSFGYEYRLTPKDYSIIIPPEKAEHTFSVGYCREGGSYENRTTSVPDISLIRVVNSKILSSIKKNFKAIALVTDIEKTRSLIKAKNLLAAGFGRTSVRTEKNKNASLHLARVSANLLADEILFHGNWNRQSPKEIGQILPGDSGGPLFVQTSAIQYAQLGVVRAVSIFLKPNPQVVHQSICSEAPEIGELQSVRSQYVNLSHNSVNEWIIKTLSRP